MARKILSTIVPSYNMETYLPKCLGSLIVDNQELLQKLEVIVVNDGSKDRTSEIAHEFEAKYPGVFKVIEKPNGHYGSCINAALPVVQGEYVKVLDADDWVATEAFEKLLKGINEELKQGDLAADLIVTDYASVDPDGLVISVSKCDIDEMATTLMEVRQPYFRFLIHSICYRTKNLQRIQYRQTEGMPYTDTEWIIEPMITVRKLRYLPIQVTNYLVGRDGQTMDTKVLAKSFKYILHITKGLLARYEDKCAKCEESAKRYYRQQVINMVMLAYSWGIMGYEGVQVEGDMVEFDKCVSSYPEFYKLTEDCIYGPNHLPFQYIKAWRRYGKNWYWKMRIAISKKLLRIAGWVFAVKRRLSK